MPHSSTLEQIRRLVRKTFAEVGAVPGQQISEHILIRNDHYCGRRFRCGEFQAVWFIEEDQIKVHNPDGAVVRVLLGSCLSETPTVPVRRAA